MEQTERDFWIALTLWGGAFITVFGTGLWALFEGFHLSGSLISAVGLAGILYMSLHLKGKRLRLQHSVVGALCLTWAFFGYVAYLHGTSQPEPVVMSGLIEAWDNCMLQVNGAKLMPWADKFAVTIICGVTDTNADRYDSRSTSIGPLHAIRPGSIDMTAAHSPEMTAAIKTMETDGLKKLGQPRAGQVAVATVPIWEEVVLFPTGMDLSPIHCLNDVHRYGGKILSQEFPGCPDCGTMFNAQDVVK